jgi:hypothetical protein
MMLRSLKYRIQKIERAARIGDMSFMLGDGVRAAIKRKELLDALGEAIHGAGTFRANVLLNATSGSGGGRLHELARALQAGPAVRPEALQ